MIQLCAKEITLPLQLLFKSMLEEDIFPDDWKKAYKKESTNLIKIICQLVFFLSSVKSLIGLYSILYLITLWKTNFLQSVSQVLYLVTHALHNCCQFIHEIYVSFDCNPSAETRGIFLDISKVFDKVWYEGLIFKLKHTK